MILKRVIPFAHSLLEQATSIGEVAIDATVGNGNDTLLLAKLVGEHGKVYGFDIQKEALHNTQSLLQEKNLLNRVTLFEQSHENVLECIPLDEHFKVASAIFNLGYLPGSDKSITTRAHSTVSAIEQIFSILKKGGIIVLVVYHGHAEGKVERDALITFLANLKQKTATILQYQFLNQVNNPPFVIAIEKK